MVDYENISNSDLDYNNPGSTNKAMVVGYKTNDDDNLVDHIDALADNSSVVDDPGTDENSLANE